MEAGLHIFRVQLIAKLKSIKCQSKSLHSNSYQRKNFQFGEIELLKQLTTRLLSICL